MDDTAFILKATVQALALSALSNVIAQVISCYQDSRSFEIDTITLGRFVTYTLLSCPPNVIWQTWLERTFPGYTSSTDAGTTEQLAKQPTFKTVSEKAGPALQILNEKTSSAATAISENETVQGLKRRATEGAATVKAKAQELDDRYTPEVFRRFTQKAAEQTTTTEKDKPIVDYRPDAVTSDNNKRLNVANTAIKFTLDQTFGAVINNALFIAGMDALKGQGTDIILADLKKDFLPLLFAGQKLWPAVSIISFTLVPLEYRTVFGGIIGIGWGIFLSLLTGAKK